MAYPDELPPSDLTDDDWRETKDALDCSDADTVLLSDEYFDFGDWPRHGLSFDGLNAVFWESIVSLLDKTRVDEVLVIIYLRRQDEYISSLWKEFVKTGWKGDDFRTFYKDPARHFQMDYASRIKCIEHALGSRGHVEVRRYDKNRFIGGDIFHDFCDAVGLAWDDDFAIPKSLENPSISNDVAAALLPFKEVAPNRTQIRSMLKAEALSLSKQEQTGKGATLFSEEEFRSLMSHYEEGNSYIARTYFGEDELFSMEYASGGVWVPNKERIAAYRKHFSKCIAQYEKSQMHQATASKTLRDWLRKLKGIMTR
ncbi:MAG: hypothetical protein IJ125_08330 [Atopobiaceae bacterium]|nr:hypothetical protein [Atopobiaceae bacterium]